MLFYLAFRLGAFLARRLPKKWGMAVSRWLGGLIYRVSPLAADVRDNIRQILGPDADPDSVAHLARKVFQNRLLNYFDLLWLSGTSMDKIGWRIKIDGLEHIEKAMSEKRGLIVVSAHIGPIEFMIQGVTALDYRFIGIMEQLHNERLHRYMLGLRSAQGLDMISTKGSLLDVYRRLKRGEVLLSAADRDSTGTGIIVDFFDAPAWMPDGYARVAVRANLPVVFGYSRRTKDGADGKVFPTLYPDHSLGKEEAVKDLTKRTVRLIEEAVREDPGAWHLSTPVWRLARERLEDGASR